MVHEVAVSCGNGAKSVGLGLPKIDHGKDHCPWFERSLSARTGTIRVVRSRVRGICTPIGTNRAYTVCSHVCGSCKR